MGQHYSIESLRKVKAIFEGADFSLSIAHVADLTKISESSCSRIMRHLVSDGWLDKVRGARLSGAQVCLHHMAGKELRPPQGYDFFINGEKPCPRSSHSVDKPRRKIVPAKQLGIARHWMDEALFGDKPANSTLEAAA